MCNDELSDVGKSNEQLGRAGFPEPRMQTPKESHARPRDDWQQHEPHGIIAPHQVTPWERSAGTCDDLGALWTLVV